MVRYIALLRAVNVGGTGRVPMAELRAMITDLGFGGVQTLLQSGNVVFDSEKGSAPDLESRLTTELDSRLGVKSEFLVRTAMEWDAVIAKNPFPDEAKSDPSHLVVAFTKQPPTEEGLAALKAAIRGREVVKLAEGHLYAAYPDGIGESKLTSSVIESKLGTRATARNWNTILKLQEMARR